jgi:CBS domain-containing protein
MSVRTLLEAKDSRTITCRPEDTIETAASLLHTNKIGALPVRDAEGRLVGMLSERDVVRGVAESGSRVMDLRVRDLMTRSLETCAPGESLKVAMEKMHRKHVRHLPIVEGEALVGIISQRDVLHAVLDQMQLEANVLRDFLIASR